MIMSLSMTTVTQLTYDCVIYENHSIIKDTSSCGGKTVDERVIIVS